MQQIFNKSDISLIASQLNQDEIVCLPTETVYGLCCKASSFVAFNKLIDAKNRPLNKAFPLAVSCLDDVYKFASLTIKQEKVIKRFMNKSLTVVVNKKENVKNYVTANKDTIAIRLLDEGFIKSLIKELGEPILLTSANKSGEKPIESINEGLNIFETVFNFVDGELIKDGQPSTIVSLVNDEVKILRQGKITLDEIKEAMED